MRWEHFCVSPHILLILVKFYLQTFIAVTFLKGQHLYTRSHYMHVDVHRVVCSSVYMWQYTTSLYKL